LTDETALPQGAPAEASETTETQVAAAEQTEQQAAEGQPEADGEQKPAKKEKTPEQREIERLRRRVDNLTRQKYELRASVPAQSQQQQQSNQQDDDEPVTLSRAELQKYVAEQAKQLAPAMTEQQAEIERRQGVVSQLAKEWGSEKFDALASELDDAFGGLADRSGMPKPATDAIFYADNPKEVIEYLTDPDNADEAERISKMTAVQAGRAIARLEAKLNSEKSKAKPKPSNAPKPIEPVRGGGVPNGMPDPSNTKAYIAWANAQERSQR
jgi:hypothetical protein